MQWNELLILNHHSTPCHYPDTHCHCPCTLMWGQLTKLSCWSITIQTLFSSYPKLTLKSPTLPRTTFIHSLSTNRLSISCFVNVSQLFCHEHYFQMCWYTQKILSQPRLLNYTVTHGISSIKHPAFIYFRGWFARRLLEADIYWRQVFIQWSR